jgi:orotate phosphoribosyltransferase
MTDLAMRTSSEERLLTLLKERSFKRGAFRLASGDESSYYIDGKMSEVFSESAYLIGQTIYEHTRDLRPDAIGGLEVGAVPLTTAAVISYHLNGQCMEGFWVRDAVKDHGTKKLIEGRLKPGDRVVILDDVCTRGNSALKAVDEVHKAEAVVILVLALVDRLQGAAELFKDRGVPYRSVFTIRDFGVEDAALRTAPAAR